MPPGGLSIIYADEHLIAADKPAGIHTAPLAAGEGGTLLGLVIERYPEIAALPGIKPVEPGLLHRLDRETSGIVLVARTAEDFRALRGDFHGSGTEKEYLAVSQIRAPAAVAGAELGIRSRFAPYGPGRKLVRVAPESGTGRAARGKTAEAVYETKARIETVHAGLALVRVRIRKGFRHQIRAHLASLGLPIVGDPLYGAPVPAGAEERMYLHALSISFRHPATGEAMTLVSPQPQVFEEILRR